jgi:hypothetical protein
LITISYVVRRATRQPRPLDPHDHLTLAASDHGSIPSISIDHGSIHRFIARSPSDFARRAPARSRERLDRGAVALHRGRGAA